MFQLLQATSNGPNVARKDTKAVEEIEKNEVKAAMQVIFERCIIGFFLSFFFFFSFFVLERKILVTGKTR